MSKKTSQTVLTTIIIILILQLIFIKACSFSTLLKLATNIKNFPETKEFVIDISKNKPFEIIDVKTGIEETSKLWFPTVFIKVKNISNKDLNVRHELKVIYIDIDNNEIINQDDCIISGSSTLFPKNAHKKFQLTSTASFDISKEKYKSEMRKRRIRARLYLDDNLIGNYPVANNTIYFNKF